MRRKDRKVRKEKIIKGAGKNKKEKGGEGREREVKKRGNVAARRSR